MRISDGSSDVCSSDLGVSRLIVLDEAERRILADAEQVPLPPMIPSRIDAQEAVALKLLKRYLNLRYTRSRLKRPPSIWLTKLTGDMGLIQGGMPLRVGEHVPRSEEHTSELQSLMRISYAVFCLQKKTS